MKNLTTTGQRLSFLIDNILNVRTIRLSETLGIKPAYLSQLRHDHKPFTRSLAYKMGIFYPQLNVDWILTGEGEPMKEPIQSHPIHADLPQVNEPNAVYDTVGRISYDDVPNLVLFLLKEVKELREMVEALQKKKSKR